MQFIIRFILCSASDLQVVVAIETAIYQNDRIHINL